MIRSFPAIRSPTAGWRDGADGRTLVTKNSFRYLHTPAHDGASAGAEPDPYCGQKRLPVAFKKYAARMLHRDLIFAV